MGGEVSALEKARSAYRPRLPAVLAGGPGTVILKEGKSTESVADTDAIRAAFPRTFGRPAVRLERGSPDGTQRALAVGVVLSGGQAAGGHNVVTGLLDALKLAQPESRLFGFMGGPRGILEGDYRELTADYVEPFRNTGGFDMIGSGRDKIETAEQLETCRQTCEKLGLDGLVVVGGDDSNTNAAVLAEYFVERGGATAVVGVPKTMDGDLKGHGIECSFGFDSATKVYAELIGNISRDARSAKKYWHFIRLMGRSASHVTLECALQTRPNVALVGEEARAEGRTLDQIAMGIADVVRRRSENGQHYGVCLVSEGLIEFIPEMRRLIDELNRLLSDPAIEASLEEGPQQLESRLEAQNRGVFQGLPKAIRRQLLLDRDAHGNVRVSQIDTELLLVEKVRECLGRGSRFRAQNHFLGYEGRCVAPSNFDADYTYSLGSLAAALVAHRRTGYICGISGLSRPAERWAAIGVPLTSMMQLETRRAKATPVIGKALVSMDAAPFRAFASDRERFQLDDGYLYPGPIQYFGPEEVADRKTRTLELEYGDADG